ncbi:MAG: hypothetical protein DI628_01985 [Blastochloris viridis]|uniref:Uncharacterized protein n=1 Tax=Blastochloris viridis TaxID=1079 RepID=A0A6N4RBL5_BLAVI|nr:MAG: hypothetical protein DI628_01985 [Blastochloris viridis]
MGLFSPKDPGEWAPAKGDIVMLKEPIPELWNELKDLEGKVILVEHTRPPHPIAPTGNLEVIVHHNNVERILVGYKDKFQFVRKP